jgi:hypothetical protein
MKFNIKSDMHEFAGRICDVKFLSHNKVLGLDVVSKNRVEAEFDDVEFIFDASWEEELIRNREILRVTKPEQASYYMYYAILKSIEAHIEDEVKNIVVIKDKDMNTKKVWIKKIEAFANGKPILIDITGKKYSNIFDIKITDLNKEDFMYDCEKELEKLKIGLNDYAKRINGLVYTMQSMEERGLYTSTLELKQALE